MYTATRRHLLVLLVNHKSMYEDDGLFIWLSNLLTMSYLMKVIPETHRSIKFDIYIFTMLYNDHSIFIYMIKTITALFTPIIANMRKNRTDQS